MSSNNLCPMCGQPLKRAGKFRRALSAYSGWKARQTTTYQNTAMTPWQPPPSEEPGRYMEAERLTPYRAQNAESDFLVPLLQSIGTGVFVFVAAAWLAKYIDGITWDIAFFCGIIAAGGFWLITVLSNRKLLWAVEKIVNSDLDSDGFTGEPAPTPPVALEVIHKSQDDSFRRMFRFDLPAGVSEDDFRDFARGVVNEGRGLAESSWTGSGKPFSKPKYSALLEVLDLAGVVRWRNQSAPAQGRELTPAGGRALRSWLQMARTHTQPTNGGANYAFIEGAR